MRNSPQACGHVASQAQRPHRPVCTPSNKRRSRRSCAARADSEVVCIIRPQDPGGKSEVITLDRVSPEFVRALGRADQHAVPATMTR